MSLIECPECGKLFQSLGYARHRTMHYERRMEMKKIKDIIKVCLQCGFKFDSTVKKCPRCNFCDDCEFTMD